MDSSAHRARQLRADQSPPEAILWKHLRNRQLGGLKFRRQHPVEGFVVDFACPEAKLVVEVDSRYHNRRQEADAGRDAVLAEQEWVVMRISAGQVAANLPGVLRMILEKSQACLEARDDSGA